MKEGYRRTPFMGMQKRALKLLRADTTGRIHRALKPARCSAHELSQLHKCRTLSSQQAKHNVGMNCILWAAYHARMANGQY